MQRSKQFFFLGPNIDNVQVAPEGRWTFQFIRTRFSTVAVDTFDLTSIQNKSDRLMDEIADEKNWPALVFVSSPERANKLACEAGDQMAVSDTSSAFADWLRANVGPGWPLVKAVEFGFDTCMLYSDGSAALSSAAYAARAGIRNINVTPAAAPDNSLLPLMVYGSRILEYQGSDADAVDWVH